MRPCMLSRDPPIPILQELFLQSSATSVKESGCRYSFLPLTTTRFWPLSGSATFSSLEPKRKTWCPPSSPVPAFHTQTQLRVAHCHLAHDRSAAHIFCPKTVRSPHERLKKGAFFGSKILGPFFQPPFFEQKKSERDCRNRPFLYITLQKTLRK